MTEFAVPTRTHGLTRVALPLEAIAARVTAHFPQVTATEAYGELTFHVAPEELVALVTFCRDDEEL
ncbi:MAG: hypothetical protein R6U94_02070, partial [Nitriliruptoraceae bacterium]